MVAGSPRRAGRNAKFANTSKQRCKQATIGHQITPHEMHHEDDALCARVVVADVHVWVALRRSKNSNSPTSADRKHVT